MHRQVLHIDGIIDSVLSLAGGQINLKVGDTSIADLTYEVVRTVRSEAKGRSVEIDYPKPSAELIQETTLQTDDAKFYDILLNLLNNAVKYSPVGSRVTVTVTLNLRGVEIRVRDRGPGIPETERPLIYDPFFRGSSAQDSVSGLGLGLYTAKLYATFLRGQISHNNEQGGGSTFNLFIPDYALKPVQ